MRRCCRRWRRRCCGRRGWRRQGGVTGLDAVAAVVGPGGFTGIRAALALAEGIGLGAGIPVIGVTTGEALAAAVPD